MFAEEFLNRLSRFVPRWKVLATLAVIAFFPGTIATWLRNADRRIIDEERAVAKTNEQLTTALANYQSLRDLRAADLSSFKSGLLMLATSKRGLYEAGLMLQEEKRLLEKQWELLVTSLRLDDVAQTITLLRESQPVATYPVTFGIPQGFGETKPLPDTVRIVSKERWAHPERGKAEKVNGELVWTPPQVGTSVRANALGEYVMFTDSGLILHGPPTKLDEHQAYPHICLGLPLETAKALYQRCFIGTKITLKSN